MVATVATPSNPKAGSRVKQMKAAPKGGKLATAGAPSKTKPVHITKKNATGQIISKNTASKKVRNRGGGGGGGGRPKTTPAETKERKVLELSELAELREVEARMAKSQVTDQLKKAFNKLADDHTKATGEPAPKYRISTPAAIAIHLLVIRLFRHKREEAAILCSAESKKTLLRKHFETVDRMHAVGANQVRCVSELTTDPNDPKRRVIHVPGTMKMVADIGSRASPLLWPLNVARPIVVEDPALAAAAATAAAEAAAAAAAKKKRKPAAKKRASKPSKAAPKKKKQKPTPAAAKPRKKPSALTIKKRVVSKKKPSSAKKPRKRPEQPAPEESDSEPESAPESAKEAAKAGAPIPDDNDGVESSDDDDDDDGGSSSDADFAH